jgi:four helix bundle protein
LPAFLKLQALRASSSVALNIAEGYGKPTARDRARFFAIALGSAREVQAVADLEPTGTASLRAKADRLAAGLYKLSRS